jgi:hypothetical protein
MNQSYLRWRTPEPEPEAEPEEGSMEDLRRGVAG